MCGFKPGDEVVYVGPGDWPRIPEHRLSGTLSVGDVVTVLVVAPWRETDLFALILAQHPDKWFDARCFRKAQRRDMSQWLETATDFEEPKRNPAKTPEPAQ